MSGHMFKKSGSFCGMTHTASDVLEKLIWACQSQLLNFQEFCKSFIKHS